MAPKRPPPGDTEGNEMRDNVMATVATTSPPTAQRKARSAPLRPRPANSAAAVSAPTGARVSGTTAKPGAGRTCHARPATYATVAAVVAASTGPAVSRVTGLS